LWSESDTIVIGTVISITSEDSGNRVYHQAEVEVESYLKNPSEASSLVIHYSTYTLREWVTPEGTTIREDIPGIERALGFKEGEKVYVFLRRVAPDFYEVVGGHQGKYTIVDGKALNSVGRRMNIPTPASPIAVMGVGLGAAALITVWIKRDWLFERIVGVNNG